jgi:capsular exopolysaccharide synthesis family protein
MEGDRDQGIKVASPGYPSGNGGYGGGLAQDQEEAVDLRHYLQVILRRWRILVLCLVATVVSTAFFTLSSRPVFEATALLEVKENDSGGLSLQKMFDASMMGSGFSERLNTEVEVLKSRQVAEGAVRRASAQVVPDTGEKVYRSLLRRLASIFSSRKNREEESPREPFRAEVVEEGPVPHALQCFLRFGENGTFSIQDEDGKDLGPGRMNEPFRIGSISFRLRGTPPDSGASLRLTLRSVEDAAKEMRDRLKVTAIRNTRLIRLQMEDTSPLEAERRLAALIAAYQALKLEEKTSAASQALEFITQQMKGLEGEVRDSMANLSEFKQEKKLVSLPENLRAMVDQIVDLDKSRNELKRFKEQAAFMLEKLQREDQPLEKEPIFALGTALREPLLVNLATELSRQEVERAGLRQAYTERHPYMQIMNARIAETRGKIKGELQRLVASMDAQLREADRQMGKMEEVLGRLPGDEQRLVELTRRARVYEDMYGFLLQKQGELQITRAGQIGDVWVVEPSKGSPLRVRPGFTKNVMLAAVVGLMLGLGLVFFLEYLDDSVKSPADLEKWMGIPVLATVGRYSGEGGNGKSVGIPLPMIQEPESALAESFRTLRSNILFAGVDKPVRTILVSSTLPEEGKTTCSANLAISLAHLEKRVVLVEADMRRPVLARAFGCHRSPGLVDVLVGGEIEEGLEKATQSTSIPGLDLVVCGHTPPNPNEMLSSQKMRRLLEILRESYDFVVLDTPPLAAASDALVLANRGAHGVVLVVRAKMTPRVAVKRSMEGMLKAQAWLLGAVMNDVDFRKDGYHYHYYQYYGYRYGHGYKEGQAQPRRGRILDRRIGRGGSATA